KLVIPTLQTLRKQLRCTATRLLLCIQKTHQLMVTQLVLLLQTLLHLLIMDMRNKPHLLLRNTLDITINKETTTITLLNKLNRLNECSSRLLKLHFPHILTN
ncbi:UNVERIFIED_CONTAM: hypothetical protein HDU68_011271, partial [Siphonaria sp. JEL0065]